jgi:hypothetical protein
MSLSHRPLHSQRRSVHTAPPRRCTLVDLCAWGIATGRLSPMVRAWLVLGREVGHA